MPTLQTGRPQAQFLGSVLLASAFILAVFGAAFGQTSYAAQENSSAADFQAAADSATAAREAGHADLAIQDYSRALKINPAWEEGWWYLGTLLYDSDRYSEAIPALQKMVQLIPSAGLAWEFLGLCEFETKGYSSSLEHLKKGRALGDSDDPDTARVANYHLALLLIRTGEFDQAFAQLTAAAGPTEIPVQIKTALALAMLRVPLLPKEVDPSQDALIAAAGDAAAAIAQNNSTKALATFPNLVKNDPGTPYLHYAYGNVLASEGRDEEALRQQREEAGISPNSALPWIEISQLQLHLQRPQEALHAAEEAVQRAPDSSVAHKTLADTLQALGKNEKAAAELALAEKLAPEKNQPEERLAQLYSNHAEASSKTNVHAAAHSATDPGSNNFAELSRSAVAAQIANNTEAAVHNYREALQLRPEWDDGRWSLAMLHYSANHYPEAIAELKIWLERHPNSGPAWAVMGLCEFEIKDYKNALVHLQRAEQTGFGGTPEAEGLARYRLALLQNQSGQFDNAMETLLPGTRSETVATEIKIVLGMALLRMPLLPDQLDPSQTALAQSAGEIAALLQNSKYDRAFPKLQALLKQYPSIPFLHYAYGTALSALSQFDESETQLRAEVQISPGSELPCISLASLQLKQHRAAEALASAQRAVQLAPESAESHYVLGRAYLELGNTEQAVPQLEQASNLAPGSPEVHYNLAKAYAKAKLLEKAERERAIFARLNAMAEQRRSHAGSQAYGASHDAIELTSPRNEKESEVPQHP
jgi:tetratricopeptide (TPR) repeat protein